MMLVRSTNVLLWITFLKALCDASEQQPTELSTQQTDFIPLSNRTTIRCIVPDAYNIGVVYICDSAISQLNIFTRKLTILAGHSSEVGYSNGIGPDARFYNPLDVLQTDENSLLIADTGNHCIREVVAGNTTTFAGVCTEEGYLDGTKMESRFRFPTSTLKIDEDHFVVMDTRNHQLRLIMDKSVKTLEIKGRALQLPNYSTCLGVSCHAILISTQDELVPLSISGFQISQAVYPQIGCELNQPQQIVLFLSHRYFVLDRNNQIKVVDLSKQGSCTPLTTVSSPQAVAYLNYSNQVLMTAKNEVGLHIFSLFDSKEKSSLASGNEVKHEILWPIAVPSVGILILIALGIKLYCGSYPNAICPRCVQNLGSGRRLRRVEPTDSTNSARIRYRAHGDHQLTVNSVSSVTSGVAVAADKLVEPVPSTDHDYDELPKASGYFAKLPPSTENEEWSRLFKESADAQSQDECPSASTTDGSPVKQHGHTPGTSLDEAPFKLRSAMTHSKISRPPATYEQNHNRRSNVNNEAFAYYKIQQKIYQDFSTNIFNNLYRTPSNICSRLSCTDLPASQTL